MPAIVIGSLEPGEGRTAALAGLGAALAGAGLRLEASSRGSARGAQPGGRSVRLLRVRSPEGADAGAEDDAWALATVPGCAAPPAAVSEQEAQVQAREAEAAGALCLIEAPAGLPGELAAGLSARVVLVSAQADDLRLGDLAAAARSLADALLGVIVTRQPERRLAAVRASLEERGLACLAALPEDRLLAGPSVREVAEALHASRLVADGDEDEAVEFVMLGPISADPGQPYFLQHGSKAVVNRFDKMDLHLAALATEPDCLILTGGQPPSPYLLDRAQGSDHPATVLLSPEGTVRTMELLDGLYGRTRFSGRRKLGRAIELFRKHANLDELTRALA